MTAVSPAARLSRGTQLGYAAGSTGTTAFRTVPGLLLLFASPSNSPGGALWVVATFLLAATAYGCFQMR